MGEVALKYRLMPESPDTDVESIAASISSAIPAEAELNNHSIKPFAFGLKAIEIMIIGPDKGGLPDTVEEALGAMEGIQSVELIEMSLL